MTTHTSDDEPVTPEVESESQRLARFNALMALVNNDGVLVWNRYYAFLTANAIVGAILAAIASKSEVTREVALVLLVVSVFGLVLTSFWWQLPIMAGGYSTIGSQRQCLSDGRSPVVRSHRMPNGAKTAAAAWERMISLQYTHFVPFGSFLWDM